MLRKTLAAALAATFVAGIALSAAAVATEDGREEEKPYELGSKVDPELSLIDIEGNEHSLVQKGKIVVIDFWSINCPWSVGYEERLKALHEEYSKKGISFLALDPNHTEVDEEAEDPYARIKAYVKEKEVPYPILIDHENVIADKFEAQTTPHVFILNAKGELVYRGGIDNDPKDEKGDEAERWVADALDALLAGEEIEKDDTKNMGCTIKRVERPKG